MRRTSYQHGSLKLAERQKGRVWEFRWREVQIDGTIRRKNIVIGSLEEFPTESAAQAAVDALRLEINQKTPQQLIRDISLETLVNHYRQHELPDIFSKTKPTATRDADHKSYATQVTYEGYLKNGSCHAGVLVDFRTFERSKSRIGSRLSASQKLQFRWREAARRRSGTL